MQSGGSHRHTQIFSWFEIYFSVSHYLLQSLCVLWKTSINSHPSNGIENFLCWLTPLLPPETHRPTRHKVLHQNKQNKLQITATILLTICYSPVDDQGNWLKGLYHLKAPFYANTLCGSRFKNTLQYWFLDPNSLPVQKCIYYKGTCQDVLISTLNSRFL